MKEKVYRIERITAKELSEFSGKSLNTCKALLSKIGTYLTEENNATEQVKSDSVTVNLTEESIEKIVENLIVKLTEEKDVTEQVKSDSVTVNLPADSYQPEPIQKPKFDFKGLSQTEEDNNHYTNSGDYFKDKYGSCFD